VKYEIVKDPIYGYIKLFDHEIQIIDTPIFQRLRRLQQATAASFAYPSATHTRFSHSLGVMHVAGEFVNSILSEVDKKERDHYYFLMRLWGLTHDIGHGPFSHLFDEVVLRDYGINHEILGAEILRKSACIPDEIPLPNGDMITKDEVAQLFGIKDIEEFPLKEPIGKSNISEQVLYFISFGAYGADLIDYIQRDSYFTGAGYGNIDWHRLLYASVPEGDKLALDTRGEEAFDSLLLARLFMFSAVYYHRTTRAAIKIMEFLLREAESKGIFKDVLVKENERVHVDLDKFSHLDEDSLLCRPELARSEFVKHLIFRTIPYSRSIEKHISIESKDLSGFIEDGSINMLIRNSLPKKLQSLPPSSFFVDTPKIPTNPMEGELFIYLYDSKSGKVEPRNIWETRWGKLSREMAIVRVYIHDDYGKYEEDIVKAFPKYRERESFY